MSAESYPHVSSDSEQPIHDADAWATEISLSADSVIESLREFARHTGDLVETSTQFGTGEVVRSSLHSALRSIKQAVVDLETEMIRKAAKHSELDFHRIKYSQHDPGQQG